MRLAEQNTWNMQGFRKSPRRLYFIKFLFKLQKHSCHYSPTLSVACWHIASCASWICSVTSLRFSFFDNAEAVLMRHLCLLNPLTALFSPSSSALAFFATHTSFDHQWWCDTAWYLSYLHLHSAAAVQSDQLFLKQCFFNSAATVLLMRRMHVSASVWL